MAGLMNAAISQLLVLQDRDSKATRLEAELESIDPEREKTRRESLQAQQVLEQAKQAPVSYTHLTLPTRGLV